MQVQKEQKELQVTRQGIRLPKPHMTAKQPLLPENTAGKAKVETIDTLYSSLISSLYHAPSALQGEATLTANTAASRRSHFFQKQKQDRELAGNPTQKHYGHQSQ